MITTKFSKISYNWSITSLLTKSAKYVNIPLMSLFNSFTYMTSNGLKSILCSQLLYC